MIEKISLNVENAIKNIRGTRSAYAERLTTGYFLDIKPKREEIARYGLSINDVQDVIASALGGMTQTITIEGRERYPVNVRYSRELRNDLEKIKRIQVPVMNTGSGMKDTSMSLSSAIDPQSSISGSQLLHVPIGQIADINIVKGPTAIKSEEGLLSAYVFVDFSGRDVGSYVEEAKKKVASAVTLPEGYRLEWSGEYEYLVKTQQRLKIVIPLTLLIIFVLIFLEAKSITKTMIILLAIPFSLVGSFWLLYLLGYNTSIAVWVGIIAIAGISAETGIVMILFLDLSYNKWESEGRIKTSEDLRDAIMEGAVKRLRPLLMTVCTNLGLLPIMFSHGAGADVMKRIAAPVIGGLFTSIILVMLIFPAIYMLWKERNLRHR
jgi:Cu(I)/Ag(I) efflux system membrane protein CusA/SilA